MQKQHYFWQFKDHNSGRKKKTRKLCNFHRMTIFVLTLFRMDLFGAAHGAGKSRSIPRTLFKICQTYPTMMKRGSYTLSKEDPKNI